MRKQQRKNLKEKKSYYLKLDPSKIDTGFLIDFKTKNWGPTGANGRNGFQRFSGFVLKT